MQNNINHLRLHRIHFIAIGGAAMHNLAIALKNKGFSISGSDDEIFEPSLSRLKKYDLLPRGWGWYPDRISNNLDAIILGMHAKNNNPELIRAQELGIKIYSYPEFLYEQTKEKTRVVVAGSHGKTTITAMVIHVLKKCGVAFDCMVGSQIEGFETMVSLESSNSIAVFEGDEYLSSSIDLRPKFLHYKPHIALISGIAWDHVNVFPSYENYVKQFRMLIDDILTNGHLVYYTDDKDLKDLATTVKSPIHKHPYQEHKHQVIQEITYLKTKDNQSIKISLFGNHNLQNISGAAIICKLLGIHDSDFYSAIESFAGTAKRLQIVRKSKDNIVFLDFAHSPSKVRATVKAVKNQFIDRVLIAVLELHTYSSLNINFISNYEKTLNMADEAVVYYNLDVIKNKGLQIFNPGDVKLYFKNKKLIVFNKREQLSEYFENIAKRKAVILLMSSGNFGGINLEKIFNES